MLKSDVIIFIPEDYAGGGVQRSAINIRQSLVDNGHNVNIKTIKLFSDGYSRHFKFIASVSPDFRSKVLFWCVFVFCFRSLLRSNRSTVVIALGLSTSVLLGLLSTGISVKGLIGSERIFPPMEKSSRLFPILRKLAFRRLNCIVGQSEKTTHWFHNELNLNWSQLAVIPNVVLSPSDEVIKTIQTCLKRRPFKATNPVILCVGRLTDQKGFDFAIRILAILQKRLPCVEMLIVGDGPDRLVLKELVVVSGMERHVTFISKLHDLSEVFLSSDILLFPSRYEGFPNVLAESMAHGLPAVAFDCPTGPADLIEHGVNGFLAEVGDVSAAAEFALTLLENHNLRFQFASRAMDVANKFSAEVVGKQWSSLVEKVALNH